MQRVAEGRTSDLGTLRRWLGQVNGRGACHLPDGVTGLIRCALDLSGPNWSSTRKAGAARPEQPSSCPSRHGDSDEYRHKAAGDPIACDDGRKLCAEILPELITLDDWGFPIIRDGDVPDRLLDEAREAVRVCPKLAPRLEGPH